SHHLRTLGRARAALERRRGGRSRRRGQPGARRADQAGRGRGRAARRRAPRLTPGEAADLVVGDSKALDELIKQGKVVGGRTDVARTGIGIAVRKGAPKPDVSSPEALKRALLAAKSIAHTAPAGGGVTAAHVMGVFEKLGIAAEVTPKV